MARDIPITVRIDDRINRFLSVQAKRERRAKANLVAIIVEEWCELHGCPEEEMCEASVKPGDAR